MIIGWKVDSETGKLYTKRIYLLWSFRNFLLSQDLVDSFESSGASASHIFVKSIECLGKVFGAFLT